MRMPKAIMRLFRRGKERRQAIINLLSKNPNCEYPLQTIYVATGSWAGAAWSDLLTLKERGVVFMRRDENTGEFYFRIRRSSDEVLS